LSSGFRGQRFDFALSPIIFASFDFFAMHTTVVKNNIIGVKFDGKLKFDIYFTSKCIKTRKNELFFDFLHENSQRKYAAEALRG